MHGPAYLAPAPVPSGDSGRCVATTQFCDGPADYDPSDAGLIAIAREARLMPGEGGIDLAGLARAIPRDAVISVEIPNHALARRMDGAARAKLALDKTRALVEAALAPAGA